MVFDKLQEPMILELNAPPGRAIKVANGKGLQPRVEMIDREDGTVRSDEERAAFSMKNFV